MKAILLVLPLLALAACGRPADTPSTGTEPMAETSPQHDWVALFDGTSTDAWRGYNRQDFPSDCWTIQDGALVFRRPPDVRGGQDIVTKETFGDFEMELEWMIEQGGNSGIFYHILEQPTQAIYWSGLEMQVLDNENHPDASMGVNGNRKAGSLYDLIPAVPQNTKPYGQWNSVRIVSKGAQVEHWMNGEKVLEYTRWTPEWFEMIRGSKFNGHPEFGAMQSGHIGLQDHGDPVHYRNIRIRRL